MKAGITFAVALALPILAGCAGDVDRQQFVEAGELTGTRSDGTHVRCEMVRVTGSRLSERICLEEHQWREMEDSAQRIVEDRQEASQVVLPASGGGPGR